MTEIVGVIHVINTKVQKYKSKCKSTADYVLLSPLLLNAISNFFVDTLDKCLSDAHAPICIKLQIDNLIITNELLAKSNALQTNLLNKKVKKPYSKYESDNCIRYRSKWMSESIDIYIETHFQMMSYMNSMKK